MTTNPPHELLDLSDDLWEHDALPVLADYVRIPCLSPEFDRDWEEHGEIRRAAELLADWGRRRRIEGLSVEVVQLPGLTPVILADIPAVAGSARDGAPPQGQGQGQGEGGGGGQEQGRGDGRPTLLYGHLDKQPPLGAWREGLAPFDPVREGDHLYGRGTADDGYSVFAALGAIEILERAGYGHGRCTVIIEASEESGSPHLGAYLESLSDRMAEAGPGLVVCLDSGAMSYDCLWSTTSLRGLVAASLSVGVLREGIHSGSGGGVVPDSFRLLRGLIDRIEDSSTGEVLLGSSNVEIPAGRRAEAEALVRELGGGSMDRFPALPGLRLAGGADGVGPLLARTWRPALAVVGMDGIPAIADAGNVLRPFTAAKLSLRIPPSADSAAVADDLVRVLTADPPEGAAVEVTDVVAADGFDAPETAPWLAAATDAASTAYFGAPGRGMGEGGSIPFLSELQSSYPDAQFLVTGVLGPDSNAHGPNEMLHIPTAKRVTASVAFILANTP